MERITDGDGRPAPQSPLSSWSSSASLSSASFSSADHEHHHRQEQDQSERESAAGEAEQLQDGEEEEEEEEETNRPPPLDSGTRRKLQLLDHLMASADMFIFAQLAALYYLDCSIFRLAIRASHQYIYFTPKPVDQFLTISTDRAFLVAMAIPNTVCVLLHLYTSLPEPLPSARGYLHGGVIVDFVGQTAPQSRLVLLFVDGLIILAQFVLMGFKMRREELKKPYLPRPATEDISGPELLMSLEEGRGAEQTQGRVPTEEESAKLADSLRSGTSFLEEIDVFDSVRRAFRDAGTDTAAGGRRLPFQDLRLSNALQRLAAEARRTRARASRQVDGNGA